VLRVNTLLVDWDLVVIMNVNYIFLLLLDADVSFSSCIYCREDKAKSIYGGTISFTVEAKKSVVFSKAITDYKHVLAFESIVANVHVEKRSIPLESTSPFPCRLNTLELLKDMLFVRKYSFLVI
jgi:hypothetical protein